MISMCINLQAGIHISAGPTHANLYSLCWPCMILVVRSVSFTVSQATSQQLNIDCSLMLASYKKPALNAVHSKLLRSSLSGSLIGQNTPCHMRRMASSHSAELFF
jgi:hypothetical protein